MMNGEIRYGRDDGGVGEVISSASTSTQPYRTPSPAPVASTSRLPCTPRTPAENPPLPTTPTSPSPRRRNAPSTRTPFPFPLEDLIPAGTVVLPDHTLAENALPIRDEWQPLTSNLLVYRPPLYPANESRIAETPITPPVTPNKGKKPSRSPKVQPRARTSEDDLRDILALQDALLLRATYGANGVTRIYLVPQDLPELQLLEVQKTRKGHPSAAMIVRVLSSVRRTLAEWEGKGVPEVEVQHLLDDPDHRSLLEIYRQIPSPPSDPLHYLFHPEASSSTKEDLLAGLADSPAGFFTELYEYQKASIVKMVARETAPQLLPDPAYLGRTALDSELPFFISVDGVVRLAPPRFREPKGGLLSENMGSGKTAISLGLIASTLYSLPSLRDISSQLDNSPSPTPILLTSLTENFPSFTYVEEMRRLRPRVLDPLPGWDPSQSELELYFAALERQAAEDAAIIPPPTPSLLDICIARLRTTTGRGYHPEDPKMQEERHAITTYDLLDASVLLPRLRAATPFYYLHPSPAMQQSRGGRNGTFTSIKIFLSPATIIIVPSDLIPQWLDEIRKHLDSALGLRVLVLKTVKDKVPDAEELANFDIILMSVSRFSLEAESTSHSALRRVHFKRIMADEGHTLSGPNRMRKLAEDLRAECRWVISGTPTKNLRGDEEGALLAHSTTAAGDDIDFRRLGDIFCRFLKHPAFPKADIWRHKITVPCLEEQRGVSRLAEVLGNAMIRNQPSEISSAYELPPLTSEIVLLDFLPTEKKTYDALLATFAINSVLSQRVDQDYFFAPAQRRYLDELTLNLSASSVFFASETLASSLATAVGHTQETLRMPHKTDHWSNEDRHAILHAIDVVETALQDEEWQQVVGSTDVLMNVRGLPESLEKFFEGRKNKVPLGQLITLREELVHIRREAQPGPTNDKELEARLTEVVKERRIAMAASKGKRKFIVEPAPNAPTPTKKRKREEPTPFQPLPPESIFSTICLDLTSSIKLNYCIEQARSHPTDKLIIFSSALPDLAFAMLSEAFDLLRISHLVFNHSSKSKDRGAIAKRFNSTTAAECQVILVDARLGGRGLNLTAANRMIMLEPIWQPDLEMQAAKRAHRLGQTKPVYLQVLVIRDSYEHAMLLRRGELSNAGVVKAKQPQGDEHLRHLLQSAKYLSRTAAAPDPARTKWVPLIFGERIGSHYGTVKKRQDWIESSPVDVEMASVVVPPPVGAAGEPARKKPKKSVRWAE